MNIILDAILDLICASAYIGLVSIVVVMLMYLFSVLHLKTKKRNRRS